MIPTPAAVRKMARLRGLEVTREAPGRFALHLPGKPHEWRARGTLAFLALTLERPPESNRPPSAGWPAKEKER